MSQLSSLLHTSIHGAEALRTVLRDSANHYGTIMLDTAIHYTLTAAFAAYTNTTPATAYLALALALSAFAYGALRRWTTVALLPASVAAVAMVALSLGRPLPMTPPAGDYQVLGAKIVVDVAIYALLDNGTSATYYVLPYSTNQANALQAAMDGEGGAKAAVGEDGGVAYDGEPPVSGEEAKVPEAPAYSVGG